MTTLFITLLLGIAGGAEVSVTTTEGPAVEGHMDGWSTAGVQLQSKEQARLFSADELLAIRWPREAKATDLRGMHVELIDGTRLPITRYEVVDRTATIETPFSATPLNVPTSQIRLVQLVSKSSQSEAMLRELRDKALAGDALLIQKAGGKRVDYLTGVVENVSLAEVTFRWDGEVVPVKRSKVAAVVYYHAQSSELPDPVCRLTTREGALVRATEIDLADEYVTIDTPCGVSLRLPLRSLLKADYSYGKLVYLSNLTPLSQKWTPRIGLPVGATLIQKVGLPRRDQSFAGSALKLMWPAKQPGREAVEMVYDKGLALRSRSKIVYRLPKKMHRFVAMAGIDPATLEQGVVSLQVFVDERLAWQAEVDGRHAPHEIDVPLDGGKKLTILVDYGDDLDFGDRLHLVEARLVK